MTASVAFFGRAGARLSVLGLREALRTPGLRVISVTCGRGEAGRAGGPLTACAAEAGVPARTFREVEAAPAPDVVLSCCNPVVFPARFLERLRCGAVNLHPAPLPAFRGSHGIEHALLQDAPRFGPTLHYCDKGIDTGPVIAARWSDVGPDDTAQDLWDRVDALAAGLLCEVLPRMTEAALRGERLPAIPQDPAAARYYGRESLPEECELDPAWDPARLLRHVRAYQHPLRRPAFLRCGAWKARLRLEGGRLQVHALEAGDGLAGA